MLKALLGDDRIHGLLRSNFVYVDLSTPQSVGSLAVAYKTGLKANTSISTNNAWHPYPPHPCLCMKAACHHSKLCDLFLTLRLVNSDLSPLSPFLEYLALSTHAWIDSAPMLLLPEPGSHTKGKTLWYCDIPVISRLWLESRRSVNPERPSSIQLSYQKRFQLRTCSVAMRGVLWKSS